MGMHDHTDASLSETSDGGSLPDAVSVTACHPYIFLPGVQPGGGLTNEQHMFMKIKKKIMLLSFIWHQCPSTQTVALCVALISVFKETGCLAEEREAHRWK